MASQRFELRLFGPPHLRVVEGEGGSVGLAPKALALLAFLAVEGAGRPIRRDTLLATFWPESEPARARHALRQALHELRRVVGARAILSGGHSEVRVDEAVLTCDAVCFEEHLAAGRERDALDLFGGEFMDGFFVSDCPAFEQWTDRERVKFRRAAVDTALRIAQRESAEGPFAREASGFARLAVDLSPYDEGAARMLMQALATEGDRAGALAAYQELVVRLQDELGVEPALETRELAVALQETGLRPRRVEQSPSDDVPLPPRPPLADEKREVEPSAAYPPAGARTGAHRTAGRPPIAVFAYAGLGLIALAVVWGSSLLNLPRPTESADLTGINTLALGDFPVVVLADASPPADVSGLPGAIATRLSYLPSLTVISEQGGDGAPLGVPEEAVAGGSGAGAALTGALEASEQGVAATVKLVDRSSEAELWNGSYRATWDDLPALESRIALEIATLLRPQESGPETDRIQRRTTDDVTAWDYVEQARRLTSEAGVDWARVVDLVDRALARDPEIAEAHAIRSHAEYVRAFRDGPHWLDSALASSERALALDVDSYYGYERLGVVWAFRGDTERSLAVLLRSLELNPSNHRATRAVAGVLGQTLGRLDLAWPWFQRAGMLDPDGAARFRSEGTTRWRLGDHERARELLLRALDLNPRDYEALRRLTQLYLTVGRFGEAREAAGRMLSLRPYRSEGHAHAAMVEAWAGRFEEALGQLERGRRLADARGIVLTSGVSWPTLEAYALAGVGREVEAERMLMRADSLARSQLGLMFSHAEYDLARIHALRGNREEALTWLRAALEGGWYFAHTYMGRRDPMLSAIHHDPEFDRLLSRAEAELDAQLVVVNGMTSPPDALEFQKVLAETRSWLEAGMPPG